MSSCRRYNDVMTTPATPYDPRYLAGVVLFNRGEFFEAHEVWESLWLSADVGDNRRFVQGLIQAAVALHHRDTGNDRGAKKLFASARNYMDGYPELWWGLDRTRFWQQMEQCFAKAGGESSIAQFRGDADVQVRIELVPSPPTWPNPEDFLGDTD